MTTRTTQRYREPGFLEQLQSGPLILDRIGTHERWSAMDWMGALFFISGPPAATYHFYTAGNELFAQIAGLTCIVSAITFVGMLSYLLSSKAKKTRKRAQIRPVVISNQGVEEKLKDSTRSISWSDIRVLRRTRKGTRIKGLEKSQQLFVHRRLLGHDQALALIEFAFLLRQQMPDWDGVIPATQSRLSTSAIYFYYNRHRRQVICMDDLGLSYSADNELISRMSWEQLRQSVVRETRKAITFRHSKSKAELSVPKGYQDGDLFDQLLRFKLHLD